MEYLRNKLAPVITYSRCSHFLSFLFLSKKNAACHVIKKQIREDLLTVAKHRHQRLLPKMVDNTVSDFKNPLIISLRLYRTSTVYCKSL